MDNGQSDNKHNDYNDRSDHLTPHSKISEDNQIDHNFNDYSDHLTPHS